MPLPDGTDIAWHDTLFAGTAENVPDLMDRTNDLVQEFLDQNQAWANSAIATANQAIVDLSQGYPLAELPPPPDPPSALTTANVGGNLGETEPPDLGSFVTEQVSPFNPAPVDITDTAGGVPVYTPVITGLYIPPPPNFTIPATPIEPGLDLTFDAGDKPTPDYGSPPDPDYGSAPTPGYGLAPTPDYGLAPTPAYGTPPEPNFGEVPNPDFGLAPVPGYGAPPTPSYGLAPAADYGLAPELLDLDLPTYVAPVLPLFTDAAPEFNVLPPEPIIQWTEPVYSSDVRDAIKAVLTQMLAGGTGLPAPVELAIWERGRQREDAGTLKLILAATDQWTSRGFSHPPGQLNGQTLAVREESARKVNELSRDIMVKQADLEQTNRNFAVTSGITYEQVFVGMFMQIVDRNFQIAKFSVETQIQIYNMQVTAFNVQQAVFAQKTERFKILLETAFYALKEYTALIEAEKLKTAVNESLVGVYKARVDAYGVQVQAFNAKVDAYAKEVGAYGTQVDAYGKEVGAFGTRVDAYGKQVGAWNGKVDAYGKRVNAYGITVDAYGKEVGAWNGKVDAYGKQVTAYGVGVDAYGKETGAYNTRVDAYGKRIAAFNSMVDGFGKRVDAYKAFIDAETAKAGHQKLKVDVFKAQIDAMVGKVQAQRGVFDAYVAQVNGEAAKAGLEESNSRVFNSKVQAFAAVSETAFKQAETKIAANRLQLDWGVANLNRIATMNSQQLSVIQANLSAYQGTVARDTAEFSATTTVKQVENSTVGERGRLGLGVYQSMLEQWKTRGTQIIALAQIQAESLRAAGQIASNLAAGAMAGTHVSAGVSAGANATQSRQDQKNESKSFNQGVSDTVGVQFYHPYKPI